MIIDCHTHLGNNEHINYSADQLIHSMDKAKIDKSLVYAGSLFNCSNEDMLAQIEPYKDRLAGVISFEICHNMELHKIVNLLYSAKKNNIYGVKIYSGYDWWYPNCDFIKKIIGATSEYNIPVIFHCGDFLKSYKKAKLKYAQPIMIDELAVDFPTQKIVIGHMAYPWHRACAEVVSKNDNVYADISGFCYGDFSWQEEKRYRSVLEEFIDVAGSSDKLLFGSDAPISNQESYKTLVGRVLPATVFNENIKKVFDV